MGNKHLSFIKSILFIFMTLLSKDANSQWLDRMSNPKVNVNLNHPPSLGIKINKIAFGPATGDCSDQIIDALISDFTANQIEVIDRQNLQQILSEHNFSLSGYVDKTTAAEIGKIIGPCALVFVKVQRCATQQDHLYENEKRYDYNTKTEYVVQAHISKTRVFIKASIQTVDLATGRIFAAQSLEASPEESNKTYERGYPEYPSEFDLQDKGFRMLVSDVHKMYLPWTEHTTLYYYDDKVCNLKDAYKALEGGDINKSLEISKKNLEECKSTPDVKEKFLGHAYYNLGMSYMLVNEYDKALENFNEAQKLRPGDIVTNAIADCQKGKQLMIANQRVEEKTAIEASKSENTREKKAQAEVANTLTNDGVIQMTKQKLPETIIIQKIKTTKCSFNTSPEALGLLSSSGVSEKVIIEMMGKQ